MSTSTIAATPTVGTTSAATLASLNTSLKATGGTTQLGQADFLKLLTTQLENQNPMQPMQDTAFIAQMATFSSLQQMTNLTTDFSSFSASNLMTTAQSYLGQQVTVTDPTLGTISGTVSAIKNESGTPQIVVNGVNYPLTSIQSVTQTSATAAAAAAADAAAAAASATAASTGAANTAAGAAGAAAATTN